MTIPKNKIETTILCAECEEAIDIDGLTYCAIGVFSGCKPESIVVYPSRIPGPPPKDVTYVHPGCIGTFVEGLYA